MVIFTEQGSRGPMWRRQTLLMLPGMIVGLGIGLGLRWTTLPRPERQLISSLPMWFLIAFLSPVLSARFPMARRLRHAAGYAVILSTMIFAITSF